MAMNKLIIIGNLTASPESRLVDTANGTQAVCNFNVAVNRKSGNKDITDYFRVSCWNKQAENVMKYLVKGSKVCVEGPISARAYAANDGTLKASLEISAINIEFLASPRQNSGQTQQTTQYQQQQYQQTTPQYAPQIPNEASRDGFMNVPPGIGDEGLPFG